MKYLIFIFYLISQLQCISVYERDVIVPSDLGKDAYSCIRMAGSESRFIQCDHEYRITRLNNRIAYLQNKPTESRSNSYDYLTKSQEAMESGKFKKAAGYAVKILKDDTAIVLHKDAANILYKALINEKKYEEAYAIHKKFNL